jgi:hypothetical protein
VSNYCRHEQWTRADADGRSFAGQARLPAGRLPGDLALGAGGPRFESGHPDHQRSSEAFPRSARRLSRSSDRDLTVDLNTGRRYWLTPNGTHQPTGMVLDGFS